MNSRRIVLDTNVLIAALRSKRGASHKLMMLLDSGQFELALSVPLVLEYEAVAKRMIGMTGLCAEDIESIIDYLCAHAFSAKIHYLWRPTLKDPKDDMILELAVAADCAYIVTFNLADFVGVATFGVQAITPHDFLKKIGALQ